MNPKPTRQEPRRWWKLFSTTRGLRLLTLICSIALAYRGYKVARYQSAVKALEEQGVSLGDPYPDYFGPDIVWDYIFYDLLGRKFGIYFELPDFLILDTYTWVIMSTPGVPDDVAAHLKHLHGVNRLHIRSDSPNTEPAENLRQIRVTDSVTLDGPWVDQEVIRAAIRIRGLRRGVEPGVIEIHAGSDNLSGELRAELAACPYLVGIVKWEKRVSPTPAANSLP